MGTAIVEKPVLRFGLTEVYAPNPSSTALVDLVFVHGLNGDPKKTWTGKESNVFWPQDLLPEFIDDQKGRVLVYGYDADVVSLGSTGVTKDKIHNHAERLVADLFANRRIRKATERPIIFVAHSLGGLIVKRALISSSEISGAKTEHLRSIYVSTYGILFLGTPHKGSDLAKWGNYLSWLCQAVLPKQLASSESQLIEALKSNSETLLNIDRQFAQLLDDFHIFFFHEAKPTNLKGTLQFIVDEESAAPTLPDVERAGIQADHSHMCKFDSSAAPGFDLVIDGIQRYSDQAPNIIRNRWVMEKQERLTRAVRKAKENYPVILDNLEVRGHLAEGNLQEASPGNSVSDLGSQIVRKPASTPSGSSEALQAPKFSEPFFIVPPGFRANTFFVGMGREMHELDQKLFDSRRRGGTACVLLHGQPGAGKSHVARQYVYKNRYKFQGGVFWINAQLIDEIYKDYWQIHQKVIAKVSPDHVHNSAENLGRDFVDDVREWFSEREEWLIVLDGVSLEYDKDIDALQRFIPDSPNCGIIYVSRSRRFENMQRLLRPYAIKISGLKEQDAQDLLFKEMGVRKPRQAQITAAKALVRKVGGLPLAISAIARRLGDTHEPIEKFSLKSYADDLKLGPTYQHIMKDLQKNGHREAINLMNIICFFGPHIPVEMIHLGLKALRKDKIEVRASEEGGLPDINITFGILMRHALIERNEPDDGESMSSSRDSTVEPEPIDVLNLHAVIQRYWCDSLNTIKQLPTWLCRAIRLFNRSFREADSRISRQAKPSRISDYRWYLVHARRLNNHCNEYETRHQPLREHKEQLDSTIERIEAEIKAREPDASQESLGQIEFQTSIFDRTSSSSGSALSQTSLDEPLAAAVIAGPVELNGQILQPSELERLVLDPRMADTGPDYRFPIIYSYPMLRDLSGSTARPESSAGLLTHANLPSPSGNARISPQRSDSFRSTSAMPMVHPGHAMGMVSVSPYLSNAGEILSSSKAASSLANLHSRSSPPRRGGRLLWSLSRRASSPNQSHSTPAARQAQFEPPVPQAVFHGHSAPDGVPLAEAGQISPAQQSLSAAVQRNIPNSLQAMLSPTQAARSSSVLGPNPAPLQYESNVSIQNLPGHLRYCTTPDSRAGSRAGSRPASRPGSRAGTNTDPLSYQNSPRSPYSAATVPGVAITEGAISPVTMTRDNSDRSASMALAPDTTFAAQTGAAYRQTRGSDGSIRPMGSMSSPLQKTTASPLLPVAFADPRDGSVNRYKALAPVQQNEAGGFGPGIPGIPFVQGRSTYAPYSEPLPPVPSLAGRDSRPATRRQSGPGVAVEGLGIATDFGEGLPPDLRMDADTQRRILDWQRRAVFKQDPRAPSNAVSRDLAERDANTDLPAFKLNRNPLQRSRDQTDELSSTDFAGLPAVSFAAPTYLQSQQLHPSHQRVGSNSAIELYDQGRRQIQATQQHQTFLSPFALASAPALVSPSASGSGGFGAGLVNSAILTPEQAAAYAVSYQQQAAESRGAAGRNSAPFIPAAMVYNGEQEGDDITLRRGRRRTLSAPESPGASSEKKLWGR